MKIAAAGDTVLRIFFIIRLISLSKMKKQCHLLYFIIQIAFSLVNQSGSHILVLQNMKIPGNPCGSPGFFIT